MVLLTFILLTLVILFTVYLYLKWNYTYWKRVGLNYLEPEFFYGNARELVEKEISFGNLFKNLYDKIKKQGFKHGGMFLFFKPFYMPVDLDVLKNILTTDFDYFVNHGIYINEKTDPLLAHIFNLKDEKWKKLRSKITPTFTSGKLKMMYQTMLECSTGLKGVLSEYAAVEDAVDIKEVSSRFTIDVIGSVAFGLDCNSLKNPESEFLEKGRKIFLLDFKARMKQFAILVLPQTFLNAINFKETKDDVEEFFLNVVKSTIKYREENNIFRKDFMHLMLQLKNRGKLADDGNISKQDTEETGTDSITFNELAAQCYIFFIAGFETTATTMTFALLELAMNQNIQEKLRQEINSILHKFNGEVTYDGIKDMKYLNLVVYETLRKHPPTPVLPRICTKLYKVPGTDVVIEKGIPVLIPVVGIHHDPEIYPDPEYFDPERFTNDNRAKRHPCAFLSFGEGPRYCIGSRFGLLQSKVGIISILRNFKVDLHQKTKKPIEIISNPFISEVKGGVWLKLSKVVSSEFSTS